MGLRIRFTVRHEGITVPYPPLRDEIRNNLGFTDVRGSPQLAAKIAEGLESLALQNLLVRLAQPECRIFTLACDVGAHRKQEWFTLRRQAAGGYVQVVSAKYAEPNSESYRAYATEIGRLVAERATGDSWLLNFALSSVRINLDDFGDIVDSLAIWFLVDHRQHDGALASRERLISAIDDALLQPSALGHLQ